MILGECCIRETGLEKDTTILSEQVRVFEKGINNLHKQLFTADKTADNLNKQVILFKDGYQTCTKDLSRQKKLTGLYKGFMFTFTPIALAGGIWLGFQLGK